ncbi:MAG: integrase core domain-containing protein, partial [Solobacterium sp.]|nr:integrase core domain-containing protein [Solobacterium sp.]
IQRSMSRAGTPTDNPVNESLNGWIKEELFIDFHLGDSLNVREDIEKCIFYFNNLRPAYSLNYKNPLQFKTEMGF